MRWTLVTAGLALLSACGSGQSRTQSGDPSANDETPFVVTATGEMEVSCGGAADGWPPSVMPEGVPGVLSDDEARGIFAEILSDPATGGEAGLSLFRDGVDVEWRVLRDNGEALTIGLGRWTDEGPVGDRAYVLELEREGDSWRPAGWGHCRLSPVLKDGLAWAVVTGYRGDAQATTITVEVHERECTSGRDPSSFLHEPFVVETAESVIIYWTSEPPSGDQTCQGNPSVERAVELSEPLGDRIVFDGSSYPPRRLRVP
jgi:hypothetical protein